MKLRQVKFIVIHHGAWKDTPEYQADDVKKDQIDRGWKNIAYDFIIENCDGEWCASIGRPLTSVGGHCKGANEISIGICFLGNFEQSPPSIEMLKFGIESLIVPLMLNFNLTVKNIYGHGEIRNTKCPGKFFNMNQFRQLIASSL